MTTKRLSLSILAASLACVMLLGGCGLSSAIVEGLSEEHFIYAGTTPHDPESREFREVLSRDGLTLYVNDKTAEIAVRDTAGVMWYSNPQERAADPVASEENKDNMSAQARIVYSDSTGNVRSMNTYTDAVSRGQFRITAEGDTLAVPVYSRRGGGKEARPHRRGTGAVRDPHSEPPHRHAEKDSRTVLHAGGPRQHARPELPPGAGGQISRGQKRAGLGAAEQSARPEYRG